MANVEGSTNPRVCAKNRRQKETIFSKIDTKVQASKKIIADITNIQYPVLSDMFLNVANNKMENRPYSYQQKAFLESEVRFFQQNSTSLGVLQTSDHYVQEEKKLNWELFPTVHFSKEQLEG